MRLTRVEVDIPLIHLHTGGVSFQEANSLQRSEVLLHDQLIELVQSQLRSVAILVLGDAVRVGVA